MSRGYRSVVFLGLFAVASVIAAGCNRSEPPRAATTTVVAALNASPKTSDFVIEAQNIAVTAKVRRSAAVKRWPHGGAQAPSALDQRRVGLQRWIGWDTGKLQMSPTSSPLWSLYQPSKVGSVAISASS
jgi:hypothetical protein